MYKSTGELTVLSEYCKLMSWQGGTIHQVMEHAKTCPFDELDNLCSYLSTNEVLYALVDPQNASQLNHIRVNRAGIVLNNI